MILDNPKNDDPILVTGAGGFIGGYLVKDLVEKGFTKIRAVDIKPISEWYQIFQDAENISLNLEEKKNCEKVVNGIRFVYNLAADMGGMGYIENNKAACMLSVLINTHLLMAASENGSEKLFYASSACVYNAEKQNDPNNLGLKEIDAYPALPEDGYGWEKLFSERMCRHFSEDFGLKTRIARYHNVYGPNGTWDGGREKAPAAICRKVAQAKRSGNHEIEIWGDGEQTRSFTFIEDTVFGTQLIMNSDFLNPFNLGSDEMVSINQLVTEVENIAGITLRRKYDPSAPKGVRGRNSDNTLIYNTLNWKPRIQLKEGLEKTYKWIYDQLDK